MREEVKAEQILCFSCIYLFDSDKGVAGHACAAFPWGIPVDILAGYVAHTEVHPEQIKEYVYYTRDSEE